ncbi:MAG: hypothetical protein J0H74_02310 [Chitinophagaceae bacterium]|nr:hypothetical protein [Chitinophagaceae bacterium]
MKPRIVSFFLLIVFRVFLVPAWFAWHIGEVKDASETFEHIRLKKRRSSYLEENISSIGIHLSRTAIATRVQRLLPFCPEITDAPGVCPDENSSSYFFSRHRVLPLYLRNRVLRI